MRAIPGPFKASRYEVLIRMVGSSCEDVWSPIDQFLPLPPQVIDMKGYRLLHAFIETSAGARDCRSQRVRYQVVKTVK